MVEQSLKGKNAVVTGGSRGIGRQIVFDLASRGANVLVTFTSDKSSLSVDELIKEAESFTNGVKIYKLRNNLRDLNSPQELVQGALRVFNDKEHSDGKVIDILVNNAATLNNGFLNELTLEQYNEVVDINLRGTIFLTQACLPHLKAPARIINISSVGARMANKGMGMYTLAKAALNGLTRVWATELGQDGTTVNAVAPGPVESEMLDKVDPELVADQKKATPVMNRVGTEDDIASIVSFLAEERSRWITGQVISASGGFAKY